MGDLEGLNRLLQEGHRAALGFVVLDRQVDEAGGAINGHVEVPLAGPCCTDQREDAVVLPSPAFRRYGQTSGVQTPACGSGPRRRRSSPWPDAGPCASATRRRSPV